MHSYCKRQAEVMIIRLGKIQEKPYGGGGGASTSPLVRPRVNSHVGGGSRFQSIHSVGGGGGGWG